MRDCQKLRPPNATMLLSPPRLSLSISAAVSSAAIVALAQPAVFSVRATAHRPLLLALLPGADSTGWPSE